MERLTDSIRKLLYSKNSIDHEVAMNLLNGNENILKDEEFTQICWNELPTGIVNRFLEAKFPTDEVTNSRHNGSIDNKTWKNAKSVGYKLLKWK